MNRLARMVVLTLALLCLFTVGAGAAVARLLPHRLALFQMPGVSGRRVIAGGTALTGASGAGSAGPTPAGVAASLSSIIAGGALGPDVGALVTDMSTGRVLFDQNATTAFAPASTTKVATAVAALDVLGPNATFTTSARLQAAGGGIPAVELVGGGDPTLAAGNYPPGSYPRPASLKSLAAATASALRSRHVGSVRLLYDGALFSGPLQGAGWPAMGAADNYITSGNVAPISGLEVDQGRLTSAGLPEDRDDPYNLLPRSMSPSADAARAFARFLRKDGITVAGAPSPRRAAAGTAIASVHSPPLPEIVQWMLGESNNVIAEVLARQVAIATGRPATFSGGASAVMATDRALGVPGISLYDGSGLSPLDRISPRSLVRLVTLAATSARPGLRAVITGMPVAGFFGTLGPGSIFGPFGPPALGTVRAKTGNITAVATMTGIAYARDGHLLAFAFMAGAIPKRLGTQPMSGLAQLATALAGCGCR